MRRTYFNLCMRYSAAYLIGCALDPTPYMRPRHIALALLAARRQGADIDRARTIIRARSV